MMMKLEIIEINNQIYTLKDINSKIYKIQFEFQDINLKLNKGDYINISEKLLDNKNEEYSNYYVFGTLNNKYGRREPTSDDLIYITTNSKIIKLKRLYG